MTFEGEYGTSVRKKREMSMLIGRIPCTAEAVSILRDTDGCGLEKKVGRDLLGSPRESPRE